MPRRSARRLLSAALAVTLATAAGGCTESGPPEPGDRAPDFVLESIDGQVRKLSNYRGKVVLVNLWATWCPPCIAELPVLDRISEQYGDRGLAVLAVAGDEDTAAVHSFLGKTPVNFEVLLDPDGVIGTRYGITGYPETFFVDRQGRLLEKIVGPLPHEGGGASAEFLQKIDGMLGG